jgi:hypothetical protein
MKLSLEKHERKLALPILNNYYRAKSQRKAEQRKSDPSVGLLASHLSSLTQRVSDFSIKTRASLELLPRPSASKLSSSEAEKALSCLIKKCDSSTLVSLKDKISMRRIEGKVRRDMDRLKRFFRRKDKKPTYSERSKYWAEESELTHAQVKQMVKSMKLSAARVQVYL